MKKQTVKLYDTTLRDGAQAEGVSFSGTGKLRLAERLDAFGVDYIEGGYAGSNEKDMAFFREVKRLNLRHAVIAAFGSTRRARCKVEEDVLTQALLQAETELVTIYGKAWRLHVKDVLRTTEDENLRMIQDTVAYLVRHGRTVFFDAEHFFDGFKDSPEFALNAARAAVDGGASAVILCDTNGGSLPHEIADITAQAVRALPVPVGIHAHDDAGVAAANSLQAVLAGAVQVQGTINGFGERCGNANLCTILPSLVLKMQRSCHAGRKLNKLRELSLFVSDLLNHPPSSRAPYVGQSAFSHKGGPHVNAVQKNPVTFEHIQPEAVGNERHVLVSELSGKSNVLLKAIELGAGRNQLQEGSREILRVLKELESKGYSYEAADASFKILIQKVLRQHRSFFDLEGFRVIVEKRGKNEPCLSEATIKVRVKEDIEQTVAEGDGPVNALDGALRKALMRFYPEIANVTLTDFRVRILDPEESTAAKTRVMIESGDGTESWGTVGVSENIIEASWEALVDSVEYKLFKEEEQKARRKATRTSRAGRKK